MADKKEIKVKVKMTQKLYDGIQLTQKYTHKKKKYEVIRVSHMPNDEAELLLEEIK